MVCCTGTQTFSHRTFKLLSCCSSARAKQPCDAASREHVGQLTIMTPVGCPFGILLH